MTIKNTFALALLGTALTLGMTASASAGWAAHHPRRVEVNDRLAHQNWRIDHDLATGRITQAQANQLHADDRSIRQDERSDAGFDNTHLTRADQRSLNQNENSVSRQIYNDAH